MRYSEKINGFKPEEIIILYKYVCWFEKIKKYTTDTTLYQQFPYQRNFWTIFMKSKLLTRKVKEMPKEPHKQPNETLVFSMSAKTKQLSFLRHLRNSIAHGTIEANRKTIVIKDYSQRAKKCTCMGNINKAQLMSFIENQVNDYDEVSN